MSAAADFQRRLLLLTLADWDDDAFPGKECLFALSSNSLPEKKMPSIFLDSIEWVSKWNLEGLLALSSMAFFP